MLDRTAIAARIPHQGDMCLLDTVRDWNASIIQCTASSHRRADNPLRNDAQLGIAAGIEYAAQAMALHGGLLAVRNNPEHVASMDEHAIGAIDLVVVNLYPFAATVAKGAEREEIIENIDIGGPSMVRNKKKNHENNQKK